MNVAAYYSAPLEERSVLQAAGFRRNDVLRGTTTFGMLCSALDLVQAVSNACDVSSIRSERPVVVSTNNRDQEV